MFKFIGMLFVLPAMCFAGGLESRGRYFSEYKMPDEYKGGVQIFRPIIYLSHDKCEASGVSASIVAKKAISFWPHEQRRRHECWADWKDGNILICPIGDNPRAAIGNACIQVLKTKFR